MNIAIIPARGGSQRIPRKNIKHFAGKPMIGYAIAAAQRSGLFEHIIVSTDDNEIAAIAQECGAEIPFVRPADLADNYTGTVPVIAHGINVCHASGLTFDNVCCIYPTVPFLHDEDLKGSLSLFLEGGSEYCFPVAAFPSDIHRALKRLAGGKMQPFYPQYELTRTQDLEPAYHDAGQFYWGHEKSWLQNINIHSSGRGYVIPNWRTVDIDTPEDWLRAEAMYKGFCAQ